MFFAYSVLLEHFVKLVRIKIAMQVVVHHHRGRVIAGSQANNGQYSEASVSGGSAKIDSQLRGESADTVFRSP